MNRMQWRMETRVGSVHRIACSGDWAQDNRIACSGDWAQDNSVQSTMCMPQIGLMTTCMLPWCASMYSSQTIEMDSEARQETVRLGETVGTSWNWAREQGGHTGGLGVGIRRDWLREPGGLGEGTRQDWVRE